MIDLYLIRHAQSHNNALPDERERICDPPLTELGHRQAEILAGHLAGVQLGSTGHGCVTRLLCSPMLRALQTARYLEQAIGVTPEVWVDIHEHGGIYLDHGEGRVVGYPGQTRQQLQAQFPSYLLPAEITDRGWWHAGYEELWACQGRAIKVANELRQRTGGHECLVMVTHGTFLTCLLKALLNLLPGDGIWFLHHNTGVSYLHLGAEARVNVRYLNQVEHLPAGLITT
jgi:broad specificity phosphatase PhoE